MLGEIENAVLKQLKQAQETGLGYQYQTLTILQDKPDSELAKLKIIEFPALWLCYGEPKEAVTRHHDGLHIPLHLKVFLQAKSFLNYGEMRESATPGLYQLMLDSAGLLHGQDFNLQIASLDLIGLKILPAKIDEGSYLATGQLLFKTEFILPENEGDFIDLDGFTLKWLQHQT